MNDGHMVLVPCGLIAAACAAIERKHDSTKLLTELRRYTTGDLSQGPAQQAQPLFVKGAMTGMVDSQIADLWPTKAQQAQPTDDNILKERDEAEDFIDALLDEVLGADRPEWSSAYGRAEALAEVQERMTALHKPMADKAWQRFEQAQAEAVPITEADIQRWQGDHDVTMSVRAYRALVKMVEKPQQAEAVPPDVVRDAVAAEREACAALAQGYAGQVGDVAWAVAAAIRGRGNAAIAQQKGQL